MPPFIPKLPNPSIILPQNNTVSSIMARYHSLILVAPLVCFLFCSCDKHHKENQLRWGKGSCGLQLTVHHEGEPRQELKWYRNWKAGTEVAAMEECCSLACSSRLAQFAFFMTQTHLSRGDTTHNGLNPAYINHQ